MIPLILLAVVSPVHARGPRQSGIVKSGDRAIAFATVTLYRAGSQTGVAAVPLATARTDARGFFSIAFISPSDPDTVLYLIADGGTVRTGRHGDVSLSGAVTLATVLGPGPVSGRVVINERMNGRRLLECGITLRTIVGVAVLVLVAGALPVLAQLPTSGLGRTPSSEEINAWDLTIPPDGQGLPAGSGTAALGKPVYLEKCASCHGESCEDPKYFLLVGGAGTLATDKPVRTVGSFWPYATTLWSYIRRTQPFDEPGSLTPDQAYAVTAYLLHLNGILKEDEPIDAAMLPRIRMPNRDGFVPDARPDVGRGSKARGGRS